MTDYVYVGADLATVTHPSNNDVGTRPVTTYAKLRRRRPPAHHHRSGRQGHHLHLRRPRARPHRHPPEAHAGLPGHLHDDLHATTTSTSGTGLVFTHITDPNGRLTKLGYDEHGRLLKSIDAASNTTTYAYTRDVLTSITDANDNVTSYHYDPSKRLDKTTFPDGKFETYTYYADGLLKTKTDRMGQTITYEYDAFKRLKKKTYPNTAQTITYTYPGQKLTQVDDLYASPAETHTFDYDASYRVQQNVQGPRGTLSYTYTPDDRVDTMTIAGTPNVTTTHTYYPDGSPQHHRLEPAGRAVQVRLHPAGPVPERDLPERADTATTPTTTRGGSLSSRTSPSAPQHRDLRLRLRRRLGDGPEHDARPAGLDDRQRPEPGLHERPDEVLLRPALPAHEGRLPERARPSTARSTSGPTTPSGIG